MFDEYTTLKIAKLYHAEMQLKAENHELLKQVQRSRKANAATDGFELGSFLRSRRFRR